jgi:hypothetical protein
MYAVLLGVVRESATKPSKHAQVIFEVRRGSGRHVSNPTARQVEPIAPQWLVAALSSGDPHHRAVVAGGGLTSCFLLDLTERTAHRPEYRWPHFARLVYDAPYYYIPYGTIQGHKETSVILRTTSLDQEPELVVDFGERVSSSDLDTCTSYYDAAVVRDHMLHLLGSCWYPSVPAWVAVNQKTWKTSMLVDVFPADFPPKTRRDLKVSESLGLLLLMGEQAYRVVLPPASQWPRVDSKVFPAAPTTKPSGPQTRPASE